MMNSILVFFFHKVLNIYTVLHTKWHIVYQFIKTNLIILGIIFFFNVISKLTYDYLLLIDFMYDCNC